MNILTKILNFLKPNKNVAVIPTAYNKDKQRLDELNLKTMEDLERLVIPLIRPATKIEVQTATEPPINTQMQSHFGGQPYFEIGEEWVKSANGNYMDFVFQIFNDDSLVLPKEIKLLQFYYDWEEFPWNTEEDGWHLKIYRTLEPENIKIIDKPSELNSSKYCDIVFKKINSLPDWEGLELYEKKAADLSSVLDRKSDWEPYQKMVQKLLPEYNSWNWSTLGAYPQWIQSGETPKNSKQENMKLLFQLDSEDNADIMWGDAGCIYLFYDENTQETAFILQCN
jgi:uncharacterized protein YwqG